MNAVDRAAEVLGPLARRDHHVAALTTYRVGGSAALFVEARSVEDLVVVARARRCSGLPVLVIGRGSNLLVADAGFTGIAVTVAGFANEIVLPDPRSGVEGRMIVSAGAGVALPVLARRTAAAGLTGFEWAVGVPGSVGGAVRMNAGGHGSDMASSLVDVDVIDLDAPSDPAVEIRSVGSLGLGFRSSGLRDAEVVVGARIAVAVGDRATSEQLVAEIVRWRREHQPGGQNCGSVFVNPIPGEVAAGALIDGLGLRGFRIGSAEVSDKHANFIVADEGGRAADVHAVMEAVRDRVAAASGYVLRSEVRLVGFEEAPR